MLWSGGAGLAISVLDYAALANVPQRQRRVSFGDPAYLFKFFGHPVIGAFLASGYAQSQAVVTPMLPILIGAAAPTIWRSIARAGRGMAKVVLKEISTGDGDSE
jgi:hypothetical protein